MRTRPARIRLAGTRLANMVCSAPRKSDLIAGAYWDNTFPKQSYRKVCAAFTFPAAWFL